MTDGEAKLVDVWTCLECRGAEKGTTARADRTPTKRKAASAATNGKKHKGMDGDVSNVSHTRRSSLRVVSASPSLALADKGTLSSSGDANAVSRNSAQKDGKASTDVVDKPAVSLRTSRRRSDAQPEEKEIIKHRHEGELSVRRSLRVTGEEPTPAPPSNATDNEANDRAARRAKRTRNSLGQPSHSGNALSIEQTPADKPQSEATTGEPVCEENDHSALNGETPDTESSLHQKEEPESAAQELYALLPPSPPRASKRRRQLNVDPGSKQEDGADSQRRKRVPVILRLNSVGQ